MKTTKSKHLFRTIKKSGVTFFAVAFIACVSIAIFHGFQSASQAILACADDYFNANNLESFEVACANGITDEDIAAIAAWDGVTAVEGGYTTSVRMKLGADRISLQARSMLETMNVAKVLEGTLPAKPDEIAIEELLAERRGVKVGDTITLEHDGELLYDSFTVTAIINQPAFCCVNVKDARGKAQVGLGSNDFYIELPKEAFDADYWSGCFTAAYVDSTKLDGIFYFSDEYADAEADYLASLERPAAERAAARYASLRAEIDGELADAKAELDDARAEIADGEKEIADAKADIADGEKKIADGKTEVADAEKKLADGKAELADNQKTYDTEAAKLVDAKAAIEAQLTALNVPADFDMALTLLAGNPAAAPLVTAIGEYRAGETALAAAKKALDDGAAEITKAEKELADAKAELATAEKELAEGKVELADAEKKLADGKVELADAEAEFAEAEADAAEVKEEEWVLSGRNDVGDVRGVQTIVDMLTGLSYAMSIVFLLVSAVICYASATRMIDEQRVLIGAQKALGATPGEILAHYMIYNLICAFLGIILGWILGVVIVENLVLFVFKIEFLLGSIPVKFSWPAALIAGGICLGIFVVATYATCSKLVKEPAITLLRGEVPTNNKRHFFEKWGAYKKLNLYTRTMIKNVLGDRGRMLTTIMGVVGCTSLLVSCITLKMGIENSSIRHFEDYFLYNHRLVVDTTVGNTDDFKSILDASTVEYTLVHDKLENFRPIGGVWDNAHVVAVTDKDALGEFMVLEDVPSGEIVRVPERGMLVSRRAAERFDLEAGSTVELMDENGLPRTIEIAGVIDHYINYHLFVSSTDYFEEVMGKESDSCVFLLKGDVETVRAQVETVPGYLSMADNSAYAANADVHNLVIAICTALAAAMALLVLLNQISMHINRKARELAVMRINGYTIKQTKAYIYKDNIILTAVGLILGCGFGIALGYLDLRIIETGACRYVRDPNWTACLIACAICTVFAIGVNILALRRIEKLSLTNVSAN